MNKQATDFALLAGAFAADQKMATQVARLLADGDINEATAHKLLKLVIDRKLCTESGYWFTIPATSGATTVASYYQNGSTLTAMAASALEAA